MITCPGEERQNARRRFGRDFCREHGDESAQAIEFVEFRQNRSKPGNSTILDMLGTLYQLASASLFLPSPLFGFPLKPLLCLCRGEHREPNADLARHVLEPLDLGVAEAATRRRASSEHIYLLELERELTCRVVIPFGKSRSVDEHRIPGIAARCQITL